MQTGSKFMSALFAVIALRLLEPGRPPSPYWHQVLAALLGTIAARAAAQIGNRLSRRRRPA